MEAKNVKRIIMFFHICCRYLFCCSYSHNVAPKGKFIAFVTTEAETDNPEVELKPGIELLGPVDEILFDTYDRYEPTNQSAVDNCFVSTVSIHITHNILQFSCFFFHSSSLSLILLSPLAIQKAFKCNLPVDSFLK